MCAHASRCCAAPVTHRPLTLRFCRPRYVDRCGKEVRYVIDFYFDDDKAGEEGGARIWAGQG